MKKRKLKPFVLPTLYVLVVMIVFGVIIFVILSKYKDKKYNIGIRFIIFIALVVPFVLSTVAYCIGKYDSNNDNCKLKEYEWHTISNHDS